MAIKLDHSTLLQQQKQYFQVCGVLYLYIMKHPTRLEDKVNAGVSIG
ncbi:hypothetical protein [Pontibacter pamirensis]|nr:hypothetical protein [Pontibacter pamirensis]